MDHTVSTSLIAFFLLTTLTALILLAKATQSKTVVIASLAWLILQSAISLIGFYTKTSAFPPRLLLALAPPTLLALITAFVPAGKRFINTMNLKGTILLHTIRIFVEITLYWLFLFKQVPALMTFEAGNIDILSGLSAPILWWAYSKQLIGNKALLAWNTLCLLFLFNAVIRALLSAPFPTQKIAFTQPNIAVLHFPFVLLPAFIVPAVFFCHLAIFRKVLSHKPA